MQWQWISQANSVLLYWSGFTFGAFVFLLFFILFFKFCFLRGFCVKTSGMGSFFIDWIWISLATGRKNFVGTDALDTHALKWHPCNFALFGQTVRFSGKCNDPYLRCWCDAKSIGYCGPIEMFAVNCHSRESSWTVE